MVCMLMADLESSGINCHPRAGSLCPRCPRLLFGASISPSSCTVEKASQGFLSPWGSWPWLLVTACAGCCLILLCCHFLPLTSLPETSQPHWPPSYPSHTLDLRTFALAVLVAGNTSLGPSHMSLLLFVPEASTQMSLCIWVSQPSL